MLLSSCDLHPFNLVMCRVKQYEGKLAALSALNSALQKECDQLRDELDEALQPKTEAGEV